MRDPYVEKALYQCQFGGHDDLSGSMLKFSLFHEEVKMYSTSGGNQRQRAEKPSIIIAIESTS